MGSEAESGKQKKPVRRDRSFILTQNRIRKFLSELKEKGHADSTIQKYRADLGLFGEFLGESGIVTEESLPRWQQSMIDAGYAPRTVNSRIVAVNSFYNHLGCRDWQYFERMEQEAAQGPDLSREEYFRILQEARNQENIQLYLLVKVMGSTDLLPSDMPFLTREAVNTGVVTGRKWNGRDSLHLPPSLCRELLEYARQRSIKTGPIFCNGNGNCHNRVTIGKMVIALGEDAGLAPGQANPRNLRRMYLSTLAEYEEQARLWVRDSYLRQLTEEESNIGWRVWIPEQARKEA